MVGPAAAPTITPRPTAPDKPATPHHTTPPTDLSAFERSAGGPNDWGPVDPLEMGTS